tara:strand:- start:55 stop:513 length:459 start_codon:yes stop_codon:yes gene_type:complete
MIFVIQRVRNSRVLIEKNIISKIKKGLLIFIGIEKFDKKTDIEYIVKKTLNIRIFPDKKNNMNLSVKDVNGEIMLVSQFTLCADTKKGRRPSFNNAAPPSKAKLLYKDIIRKFKETNLNVKTGEFGANMNIEINNNGPVTIILNSKDNDYEN